MEFFHHTTLGCLHIFIFMYMYVQGGHGNPLQYSCLQNPTDRGTCRIMVYGVTKSQTQPSDSAYHKLPWRASPGAQVVNSLFAMPKTKVQSLGWIGDLEKGLATHSSILAWRSSRTEEPGGLQSMGLKWAGHDWAMTLPPSNCSKTINYISHAIGICNLHLSLSQN